MLLLLILNGKTYSRAVRAHMRVDTALYAQLLSSAYDRPRIFMHHDTSNNVNNTVLLPSGLTSPNHRALHVDGSQKTDYVLPHLRQSRNSELCLTQSQYTDTGPTSRTRRSWGKCNGVDAGAYHTGFPAEAPYPTFPL